MAAGCCAGLALCAAACTDGRSATTEGSPFELRLILENRAGEVTSVFDRGEPVVLELAVRNPGATPQRLTLASARTHDFAVANAAGEEVWRWSAGRRFAQMLTDLVFAPGEEKLFRTQWGQGTEGGAAVPAGRYRASGWLRVGPGSEGPAASASFTIE